jgi:hypothetical protein
MRCMVVVLALLGCGPPSDQEMLDNLDAKRASFEQLVRMIREDPQLERVDNDWLHSWTRPEDLASIGVSAQRLAEYHRLLSDANIARGFYSFEGGAQISFVAYASGLSISGSSKSYLYTREAQPVPADPPLDALHSQPKAAELRRVEPHWSLEFTTN